MVGEHPDDAQQPGRVAAREQRPVEVPVRPLERNHAPDPALELGAQPGVSLVHRLPPTPVGPPERTLERHRLEQKPQLVDLAHVTL